MPHVVRSLPINLIGFMFHHLTINILWHAFQFTNDYKKLNLQLPPPPIVEIVPNF